MPEEPDPTPEEAAPIPENTVPGCENTVTRRYLANKEQCAVIRYSCPEGQGYFGDDCGCGCEKK